MISASASRRRAHLTEDGARHLGCPPQPVVVTLDPEDETFALEVYLPTEAGPELLYRGLGFTGFELEGKP